MSCVNLLPPSLEGQDTLHPTCGHLIRIFSCFETCTVAGTAVSREIDCRQLGARLFLLGACTASWTQEESIQNELLLDKSYHACRTLCHFCHLKGKWEGITGNFTVFHTWLHFTYYWIHILHYSASYIHAEHLYTCLIKQPMGLFSKHDFMYTVKQR